VTSIISNHGLPHQVADTLLKTLLQVHYYCCSKCYCTIPI